MIWLFATACLLLATFAAVVAYLWGYSQGYTEGQGAPARRQMRATRQYRLWWPAEDGAGVASTRLEGWN